MTCTSTSASMAHAPDLSELASDLQTHLQNIVSLNYAIDHSTDFPATIDKDAMIARLGRACCFLSMQEEELGKARSIAEQIEILAVAARRG